MSIMQSVKRGFHTAVFNTKKHSPIILMTVAGVGFFATMVGVYKSKPKIEAVIEGMEEKREAGEPINKPEVIKDMAIAVAWPLTTSALTIACAIGAYTIQKNRILGLAGALASAKATQEAFEHKFKTQLGEQKYNEIATTKEETYTDEDGEEKTVFTPETMTDGNFGEWYSNSSEYFRDDHAYNMMMIKDKARDLEMVLFAKGHLLLNEVRETLGFERSRSGALLGWTAGDYFNLETIVGNFEDPKTHQFRSDIFIKWNPKYIYGDVDFGKSYLE